MTYITVTFFELYKWFQIDQSASYERIMQSHMGLCFDTVFSKYKF